MIENFPKSPLELVFDILDKARNTFLSLRDIKKNIFDDWSQLLDEQTIVKYIDQLKRTGHTVAEKYERRGVKRITTKVFSLTIIQKNEHQAN